MLSLQSHENQRQILLPYHIIQCNDVMMACLGMPYLLCPLFTAGISVGIPDGLNIESLDCSDKGSIQLSYCSNVCSIDSRCQGGYAEYCKHDGRYWGYDDRAMHVYLAAVVV